MTSLRLAFVLGTTLGLCSAASLYAQTTPQGLAALWLSDWCANGDGGYIEGQLMGAGTAVQHSFIEAAMNGPPSADVADWQVTAGQDYDDVLAEVAAHAAQLGLNESQIASVQHRKRDDYVITQVDRFKTTYRAKALSGLAIAGNSEGLKVINSFANDGASPLRLRTAAMEVLETLFTSFSAAVEVTGGTHVEVEGWFNVAADNGTINPVSDMAILKIGGFASVIAPGSFSQEKDGSFAFEGQLTGVNEELVEVKIRIKPLGVNKFVFSIDGFGMDPRDIVGPLVIGLAIGNHTGTTQQHVMTMPGDLNTDGIVDLNDLGIIQSALNTTALGANDPRDLNHDKKIDALDARILTTLCTYARCASHP